MIKTLNGGIQILPELLEKPSKTAKNVTAIIDSNGFGGIAVCSHTDKFDYEDGALMAFEYRDRALRFHNKSGVKVIMAKNQEFPPKKTRQKILEYVKMANNENTGILNG